MKNRLSRASSHKQLPTTVKLIIKWVIYVLLGLAAFCLCTTGSAGSSKPLLLLPLAIGIAIFEGEIPSCIMGAYLGLLLDIATDRLLGFSAFYLCILCGVISALFRQFLRKNIYNFALASLVCEGIYLFLCRYFFYTIWQREGNENVFRTLMLPSAVKTYVLGFAVYGLCLLLVKLTGDRKRLVIEEKSEMIDRI